MEYRKIYIENFVKIRSAEIELAPMLLFVGDNNSGKSYLTSLIWGLQNYGRTEFFSPQNMRKSTFYKEIYDWIDNNIGNSVTGDCSLELKEYGAIIQNLINDCLDYEKKKKLLENDSETERIELTMQIAQKRRRSRAVCLFSALDELHDVHNIEFMMSVLCYFLLGTNYSKDTSIYLPASRTGFMLTKDIINQVGRDNTFNETQGNIITPFTRPINNFLTVINNLSQYSQTKNDKYGGIVGYIETDMADGVIAVSDLPNKEVRYVPNGRSKSLPLRVVSGVVTELSPLLLLLKYSRKITNIFYEEPEIGLHPQLQKAMGRVLCRIVNSGINVCMTTHSDLIIQHINNMIALNNNSENEKLMEKYNYSYEDLLDYRKVRVYQFNTEVFRAKKRTILEEVECGVNGFAVPTFNDTLDDITDEAYNIQE